MEDSNGICSTLAAPHERQGGSRWSSDECSLSSLCLYLGPLACRFCPFKAGHFCMPTCFRMDMNFGSDQGLPTDVLSRFGWSVAPPSPNRPHTGEIYNGVLPTRAQRRFRYRALAVLHTSATRLTCKAGPRCYLSVRCHAKQTDRLRPSRTFPASLRVFLSH